jgi:hypothetical protein
MSCNIRLAAQTATLNLHKPSGSPGLRLIKGFQAISKQFQSNFKAISSNFKAFQTNSKQKNNGVSYDHRLLLPISLNRNLPIAFVHAMLALPLRDSQ